MELDPNMSHMLPVLPNLHSLSMPRPVTGMQGPIALNLNSDVPVPINVMPMGQVHGPRGGEALHRAQEGSRGGLRPWASAGGFELNRGTPGHRISNGRPSNNDFVAQDPWVQVA